MTGMNIDEFLDKVYYGDEIEFQIGATIYFIQGNCIDGVFTLTVDYWNATDGTEPNHDYLLDIKCSSAKNRLEEFEKARIFGDRTIYEAESDVRVLFG